MSSVEYAVLGMSKVVCAGVAKERSVRGTRGNERKLGFGSVNDDQITGTLGYRKSGRRDKQCDGSGSLQSQGRAGQDETRTRQKKRRQAQRVTGNRQQKREERPQTPVARTKTEEVKVSNIRVG